jgi:hypothetical protein
LALVLHYLLSISRNKAASGEKGEKMKKRFLIIKAPATGKKEIVGKYANLADAKKALAKLAKVYGGEMDNAVHFDYTPAGPGYYTSSISILDIDDPRKKNEVERILTWDEYAIDRVG